MGLTCRCRILKNIFLACFILILLSLNAFGNRSFIIDYENNQFLKDGEPFQYISGSMHYFRVPKIYWMDRLSKMKAMGLNTIQTYIEWSQHEPHRGSYNFEDNLDVITFIKSAQNIGLLVILRPGPYICAERDMGGLPFWLLKENSSMLLRSRDPTYLDNVDRWFGVLLPMLTPLLYANGGPVIAVQVENEYGNYPVCDKVYMAHLRDELWHYLGKNVILFTTDAAHDANIECGKIDGVYSTVDFEPVRNISDAFETMRRHQPKGPLVNSELYVGWLDFWSFRHTTTFSSINVTTKALDEILSMNASVNLYMFHGGTSFGFSNGANFLDKNYRACPTSYDYNAPLSEAGDPSPKFYALRAIIAKHTHLPPTPKLLPIKKYAYGKVSMEPIGDLFQMMKFANSSSVNSIYPLTFEEMNQAYGFVLYETIIKGSFMDPVLLQIPGLRDRGIIFLNEEVRGIVSRQDSIFCLSLQVKTGQKLSILVENQGRIGFGPFINDSKGILGNVTLGSNVLKKWSMSSLPLNTTETMMEMLLHQKKILGEKNNASCDRNNQAIDHPGLFYGTFTVPKDLVEPLDTFLRLPGWSKGVAFINGFNIGRYWPVVGPQVTLYVPKSVLKPNPKENGVLLFELEASPCRDLLMEDTNTIHINQCVVKFVSEPEINGMTPYP